MKLYNILWETTKRSGYQKLDEVSIARVLGKHMESGFIIISGDVSPARRFDKASEDVTDEDVEAAREINRQKESELKADIRSAGYSYIPTWGGYREMDKNKNLVDAKDDEASFIVPNYRVGTVHEYDDTEGLERLGRELCAKYDQETFFFKPPSDIDPNAYLVDRNGNRTSSYKDFVPNDVHHIYFTALRSGDANQYRGDKRIKTPDEAVPRRFSGMYIPESPRSVEEARKRFGEIFINLKD